MSTKRRSFTRFLSCLLALCLLLSIIPATAESPATPTDLGPVIEEGLETTPQEVSGDPEAAGETEDPEDPDGSSGDEAEIPEDGEAADLSESDPVESDPYLATLKAGARLYADRDCYRKQQILAEEAVVLVVKMEESAAEILYAYLDIEDQAVPGKAYVHSADLTPLTEDETATWQAATHPEAVERLGFSLEPVAFGTEEDAEPDETAEVAEGGETGEKPAEAAEEKAGEEPAEVPEGSGEGPEAGQVETPVNRTGRLSTEKVGEKIDVSTAVPATPTDLSALPGLSEASAGSDLSTASDTEQLNGDSYTTSDLPTVRNQGQYGTCWAFSAIGAMEIYLIKTGSAQASTVDLSELFLVYYVYHVFPNAKPGGEGDTVVSSDGTDPYLAIGGTNLLAIRVLENLIGTVAEGTVPYSSAPSEPSKYEPIAAQLTGAYIVDVGSSNKDEIKKLIREHGAVGASVYMPDDENPYNRVVDVPEDAGKVGFNTSTKALYGTTTRANHDILLVGWDDDFPKTNFVSGLRPSGNGAWKVRNSWGDWLGGYFWISYEDAALTGAEGTAYSAINANSAGEEIPDFCYSYNKIPDNDSYEAGTAWVLKRPSPVTVTQSFTVDGNEKILSVGVETGTPNVTIGVAVVVDGESVSHTGSVTAKYKGFYRVKLGLPAVISSSKRVTVSVTIKHANAGTLITVPYEPGGMTYNIAGYDLTTHSGSGGFRINGETVGNADSCIKLYTKKNTNQGVLSLSLKCDSPSLSGESISISEARIGKTYQLTAVPYPATGVDTTVRWTSTNPGVATVSSSGLVTVLSMGSTEIYAVSVNGKRAVCKVTVPAVKPESVKIDGFLGQSEFTINNANAGSFTLGKTLTIVAWVNPDYNTNPNVTWESSDPSVLQIMSSGWRNYNENERYCEVKVLKDGRSRITVRSTANSSATDTISLVIDLVTGVSVDRSECELTAGDGVQLAATVEPADAWNKGVTWSSSDTSVATVDGNGYVTAVAAGRATITATTDNGGLTAGCTVIVDPTDLIEAFVYRMYRICLQREPDADGLQSWVAVLRSGQATGAQIAYGFYHSDEMIRRGLSNGDYVTLTYRGIMGREPDAGGKAAWTEALDAGMSYSSIISGFIQSNEFTNLCAYYGILRGDFFSAEPRDQNAGVTGFVSRLYTKLLSRGYDADGLNAWCAVILANPSRTTLLQVSLTGFMHSVEFQSKGLSDADFVKVMYRTFLDRECDASGLNAWVAALQSGSTRDQVAAGFAYSAEFSQIMARYGFQ